ncbi:hypothetical protein JCM8547_008166 [Rhodosporidiobolus lusitaniae]
MLDCLRDPPSPHIDPYGSPVLLDPHLANDVLSPSLPHIADGVDTPGVPPPWTAHLEPLYQSVQPAVWAVLEQDASANWDWVSAQRGNLVTLYRLINFGMSRRREGWRRHAAWCCDVLMSGTSTCWFFTMSGSIGGKSMYDFDLSSSQRTFCNSSVQGRQLRGRRARCGLLGCPVELMGEEGTRELFNELGGTVPTPTTDKAAGRARLLSCL